MRRTWPILMAATALLVGCSSGESTPATVTVTDSPSEPSPVVVEDEYPHEDGFFSSQFHPCEAFSEIQLERAGLGKRSNAGENPESVVKACGFGAANDVERKGAYLIATDQLDRQRLSELGLDSANWPDSAIEGIYIHLNPSQPRDCTASYDFEWGRFLVDHREFSDAQSSQDLCSESVKILESLILQAGGIHGT